MRAGKLKKYWSWIGPYPYNPWLIFIFFAAIYFSRFLPGINQQPAGGARWLGGITILVVAAFPSGMFAFLAYLIQRYRPWPSNTFTYVLEVAVGQAFLLLFSPIVSFVLKARLGLEYSAPVTLNPSLFTASLILVLGMLAIMHYGERAVLDRLKAADNLIARLEIDREGLIKADEELRKQTSRFLHDRVQSDLMVSSMKLKSIAGSSTSELNDVISQVISRLERTRTTDIKDLVQILTPNFEAAGFKESVRVLAQAYRSSMTIDVIVDEASENLSEDKLLGAFRIIEQALINSLLHGPANNVKISLVTKLDGLSRLEISDDGSGSSNGVDVPGVGTAVIDSWVGILKGSKTIDTVPGHGYTLIVEFYSSGSQPF